MNLAIFLAYRLVFLATFAEPGARAATLAVVLRGMRLDVALLGIELLVLLILSLATRHLRYRLALGGLWAFTLLNLLGAAANLLFFRERNQHLWENLLANASEPREMWVAVEPLVRLHPTASLTVVLAIGVAVVVALRRGRSLTGERLDLWSGPRTVAMIAPALLILVAVQLEPVADQKVHWLGHVRLRTTASKHYMNFDDYVLNQAVVNPVFDIVHNVPDALAGGRHRYRLDRAQALDETNALLGLPADDPRYPLLRTVHGGGVPGIRNVILLQVEGLGTNVFEQVTSDGPAVPYLRELAKQGLYFPNVYQSFCATDGSTFAIATSLHRTYAVSEGVSRFFPHEINGRYATLSNVLGAREYRHYFIAGFRQRIDDFLTFMGNQGYEAVGFEQLAARLGDEAERASNGLGLFDGPMLQTAADILLGAPGPFTAHIATATSHSPWEVPPGTTAPFTGPLLAFRYADDSIRYFVERLRRELADFDRTLFVIVGDHTSITFTDGLIERVRVPLILYSPALVRERTRWVERQDAPASHVDILPTILALLDGEHRYGGMGTSLLAPRATRAGIISSTYSNSLYIKEDLVLRYTPRNGAKDLYAFEAAGLVARDVSSAHPEATRRLTAEYLALFETTDRLTREKRIVPPAAADHAVAAVR